MENKNQNIPIFNFIESSLKEKNKEIIENIRLGNVRFPSFIFYAREKNFLQSDENKLFLNELLNELSLTKIKEEKSFLNNKIELTNKKILNLNKNYSINNSNNNAINNNNNYNRTSNIDCKTIQKSISHIENINSLPALKIDNSKITIKRKKLTEIKPLIAKQFGLKNKIMNNNDTEYN